jgi:hypothetical protein
MEMPTSLVLSWLPQTVLHQATINAAEIQKEKGFPQEKKV